VIARFTAAPAARLAAALLTVALSGTLRLASPDSRERHVCQCAARGKSHDCSCPICRANERQRPRVARTGDDAGVPPCHRAMVAGESSRARGDRSAPPVDHPLERDCLSDSCGTTRPAAALPTGLDPFTLPSPVAAIPRAETEPIVIAATDDRTSPQVPELPPPRRRAARPSVDASARPTAVRTGRGYVAEPVGSTRLAS
jgi:hypothetical protein